MGALADRAEALEIDVRSDADDHTTLPIPFMVRYAGELLAVGRATYVRADDDHRAIPAALRTVAASLPTRGSLPTGAAEAPVASLPVAGAARVVESFRAALRLLDAGVEAAVEDLAELLADDVAWHVPGRSVVAGDFHGSAEVLAYLADRRHRAGPAYALRSGGMLADGRYAVHFTTGSTYLGGRTHHWETAGVYRVTGDEIAEVWQIPFDQRAFDRIWSPQSLAA